MGKLHFYTKNDGNEANNVAEGDGTVEDTGQFNVTITAIKNEGLVGGRKKSYFIKQGQHWCDGRYWCDAVPNTPYGKGEGAKFTKVRTATAGLSRWTHLAATVRSATQAAQKTVRIEIDTSDLEELKGANYKLCFAKKVGDDYDVVWQSYTKYLPSNTFSWTPQYQLFGANVFNDRVNVEVSTNLVSIGLGETCILDSAGVLLDPSTSGPTDSITMNNKFNLIHPGIKQLSTGIDGAQISTAIYVAPKPAVMGPVVLTPVEKVLVWFEQDIVTSTMFSDARSNAVEIDLTLSDAQTRLYKDQQWSKPPAE